MTKKTKMRSKISQDIGYSKPLLDSVFKCGSCGTPLLMFGCDTKDCDNNYHKRIQEDKRKWLQKKLGKHLKEKVGKIKGKK